MRPLNDPEPGDLELVRRAVAGETDAFAAIYDRYHTVVYRFARAMSDSRSIAEDVTQETFVALIRDLRRYDPQRSALSTYLYGVTRNLVRWRLRRERRFVGLGDALAREPSANQWDHSVAIGRSRDLERLRRVVLSLPSRYREVVILCDLHGLSYAEAATIVRAPVGTVRSRLHRGRQIISDRFRWPRTMTPSATRTEARCTV